MSKVGKILNAMKSTVLLRWEIQKKIKTIVAKEMVRSVLLHCTESWIMIEKHKTRKNAVAMKFLKKIQGKTRKDKIRNDLYRYKQKLLKVN